MTTTKQDPGVQDMVGDGLGACFWSFSRWRRHRLPTRTYWEMGASWQAKSASPYHWSQSPAARSDIVAAITSLTGGVTIRSYDKSGDLKYFINGLALYCQRISKNREQ